MSQLIADKKDIDFVMYDQLGIEKLTDHPRYKGLNRKTFDLIIAEARNLGIKEILPTNEEGDRIGVRFENGKVQVPECFHRVHKLLVEGEWIAMAEAPEVGGQGLPSVVSQAATEYLMGGNFAMMAFSLLNHGAGKMIELFGTEQHKSLFLEKLYSGRWGGTMLLTEPGAGSDVGALTTTAVKNEDGTYSITGSKIFITNGEQDLTENIIHPVLARIEGAPCGTKGISLFIVPKIWVNEDGTLGAPNDVVCTGVEEKMGLHGSPTCSMTLGGRGRCRGFLLGQENQGMQVMFNMMNEARLCVGANGLFNASTAYLYALNYARERRQGRALVPSSGRDMPQVFIIDHPDVRRMLLNMKATVEGMRSFVYYLSYAFDKVACAETEEEKAHLFGMIEFLTPVVKSYCSDRGFEVCVQGLQVFGGYGYTCEFPIEQLVRDSKINSVYEGTNGIQANDLLGRKLNMSQGKVLKNFVGEIRETVEGSKSVEGLEGMALWLEEAVVDYENTAGRLREIIEEGEIETAFAQALPFLDVTGDIVMAWMHLWRAFVAIKKREKMKNVTTVKKKDTDFYDGKIKTAGHYFSTCLPVTMGKMKTIRKADRNVMDIGTFSF